MNNDSHQLVWDRWGGPRSNVSKGLCRLCHRSGLHPKCIHYWVYESPNGPFSIGVCKLCGERTKGINTPYTVYGEPVRIQLGKRKRTAPHGMAR